LGINDFLCFLGHNSRTRKAIKLIKGSKDQ